jgi:aspartate racemase
MAKMEIDMKKIGIIGGLGPESTIYYYRTLIDMCRQNKALNGNYPEVIIYSMNIVEISSLRASGDREGLINRQVDTLTALHNAGADLGIISCNACHGVFDEIEAASPMPVLSIVTETCKEVVKRGLTRVALFGMESTMNGGFYQEVFGRAGISVYVPDEAEQKYVSEKLRKEATLDCICDETKEGYLKILKKMVDAYDVQGLILGCTEMPLLMTEVEQQKAQIPFFDTGKIHVQSALAYSLAT